MKEPWPYFCLSLFSLRRTPQRTIGHHVNAQISSRSAVRNVRPFVRPRDETDSETAFLLNSFRGKVEAGRESRLSVLVWNGGGRMVMPCVARDRRLTSRKQRLEQRKSLKSPCARLHDLASLAYFTQHRTSLLLPSLCIDSRSHYHIYNLGAMQAILRRGTSTYGTYLASLKRRSKS